MNSLPIYVDELVDDFVYVRRPRLGSYWRLAPATGVCEEVFQLPRHTTDINSEYTRQAGEDQAYQEGKEDGYAVGFDDGYDRGRDDERDSY